VADGVEVELRADGVGEVGVVVREVAPADVAGVATRAAAAEDVVVERAVVGDGAADLDRRAVALLEGRVEVVRRLAEELLGGRADQRRGQAAARC